MRRTDFNYGEKRAPVFGSVLAYTRSGGIRICARLSQFRKYSRYFEFVKKKRWREHPEYLGTCIIHKVVLQQSAATQLFYRLRVVGSCSDLFACSLPCLLLASWWWWPEWDPGAKCSSLYVISGVSGWTAWDGCTTGTLLDCGETYKKV